MDEHIPVLYQEIIHYLAPKAGGRYIDGTIGAGGHSAGLLEASSPDGMVLGFDRDAEALAFAGRRLQAYGPRLTLVHASYAEMGRRAPEAGFDQVDGILLDLGLSSRQLEDPERGFAFQLDGPLDMRFDVEQGRPASDLINNLTETGIADLLRRYGEVRASRKIAAAIVRRRPIRTTRQLADAVETVAGRRGRIHPATQVFQALRIAVNQELETLTGGLEAAVALLRPGGRLAVISFHSLEDRLVKQFVRSESRDCVCPPELPVCTCEASARLRSIHRKVIRPTEAEVADNPRSRSARLRVAERVVPKKE
jgi:16S rRNA (cytosine1402-N4)-methyltransferase